MTETTVAKPIPVVPIKPPVVTVPNAVVSKSHSDERKPTIPTLAAVAEAEGRVLERDANGAPLVVAQPPNLKKVRELAKAAAEAPPEPPKAKLTPDGAKTFRTKSGRTFHREGCGSLKNRERFEVTDNPKDRRLEPCKKCQPHVHKEQAELVTGRSVVRSLTACQHCLKHGMVDQGEMTQEQATQAGYSISKSGSKYHLAECRFVGGPGFPKPEKKPRERKVKATKTEKQDTPAEASAG